jgi:hypothetical protein
MSILDKVWSKLKTETLPGAQRKAIAWFRSQISSLGGATRQKILADRKRQVEWFTPGTLFLFVYDPKTKEKLPYYDRFPLVFPVEFYKDGMLGINLHYLDYRTRLSLFRHLLSLADSKTMDERTRLRLSYKILKTVSKYKAFKPCLKRYLSSHVQSHAIKIDAPDWETALFLPVENFAKRSRTAVWQDSTDIIAGRDPKNVIPPVGSKRKGD